MQSFTKAKTGLSPMLPHPALSQCEAVEAVGSKGSARVLNTTLPTLPNDMVSLVCADLRFVNA